MTTGANKSAMTGQILRANDVDMSKFTFCDPTVNKYGGKSARVKYDGRDFVIQTPRMRLPYGLGTYEEKDKNGVVVKTKYSLDFSFAGYEQGDNGTATAPKVREFYDMLSGMQKLLIKATQENSSAWLDMDDVSEGVAKALTRELLKFSKDKVTKKVNNKYPPTFKTKVGYWEGKFMLNAFDENKNPIEDLRNSLPKGSEAVAIIKLTGVTFAGGKVGYSFQINQLKVYAPQGLPSYAFLDDGEEYNNPVKSKMPDQNDESEEEEAPQTSNKVDDSSTDDSEDELDVEDSEEEEEEKEPTPPPSPKKKKVVKRVKK